VQQFKKQSQKLEEQRGKERTKLLWNPRRKNTKISFREYRYELEKHLHGAKNKAELEKSLAKIGVKP